MLARMSARKTKKMAGLVLLLGQALLVMVVSGESRDCLRFLALGDWGTPLVANTALAMAARIDSSNNSLDGRCNRRPESILMLGDNFYESGLSSSHDPLFAEYFERNFVQSSVFNGISFSVIAGNHDHYGNVQAQIDLHSPSTWYFPNKYYSRVFSFGGVNVLVAFIDTWDLIGGDANDTNGNERIVDSVQLKWLDDVLNSERVTYKLVIGHYPIRSHNRDTRQLVQDLLPVLQRHKVDAYVFGHDHVSQTILRDGLHYIGSGVGGGAGRNGVRKNKKGLRWSRHFDLGFIDVSLNESEIIIDFYHLTDGVSSAISFTTRIPRNPDDGGDSTLQMKLQNRLIEDW